MTGAMYVHVLRLEAVVQYLFRVRVYPAQSDEVLGQHVVEQLRLVRRLDRVGRTLWRRRNKKTGGGGRIKEKYGGRRERTPAT